MSDRQRHRAFFFSALFVAAVCVLVGLVERPPSKGGADAARVVESGRPLVLGADAGGPSAEAVPGEVPIVATARRFTNAFVKYEVGQLPVAVRHAIQVTATPSFATSLLSAPPDIPNGVRPPPPPPVRSVVLADGPESGRAAVAVELATGGGEESTLTELLWRTGRGWRISGLG